MIYNALVFKHIRVLVVTCVVGTAFTLAACTAQPPAPIQWKDGFEQRGYSLGFEDPHVRDTYMLMMYRNGCVLVQRLDNGIKEVMELRGADGRTNSQLPTDITRSEIEPYLRTFGCNK